MTSRSLRWLVFVCACVLATWVFFAFVRREPPAAAASSTIAAAEAPRVAPELALPDAAADERARRAAATEPDTTASAGPAEAASRFGALRGRVLLDATFSDAHTHVTLLRRGSLPAADDTQGAARGAAHAPRAPGQSTVSFGDLSSHGETDDAVVMHSVGPHVGDEFEFEFEGLVPGLYQFGLAAASQSDPEFESELLEPVEGRFFTLDDVRIAPGEPTRDPRLDPLDLRGQFVRARYVIVDEYGVPRASAACRAIASATSQSFATSDEHGNVEFVLAASAETIELEVERLTTCIVRTPLAFGRSVVVVPARPTHVLHVDPDSLPASGELSIFVREAEELAGASPLGRGATWSRFDAAGDAVVAPRRLGPHELEWRLKRADGTTTSLVDPTQRIEVRAATDAVLVSLVMPAQLR